MALKWGIICSVPPTTNVEELKEFGQWFTECTEMSAKRFNLDQNQTFDEIPVFVFPCEPNSEKEVRSTYRKIYTDFPNVLFVIHILPKQNAIEFALLKELSIRYAIIGQGILLSKALNRFDGLDLDAVFANVNQYISRRLAQIVDIQREENLFHMYVGEEDFQPIKEYDRKIDLACSISHILHQDSSTQIDNKSNSESFVIITGFPSSYNQYDIAKLFGGTFYRIVSIRMENDGAIVEFSNKFHVAQATLEFNKTNISENFTLLLTPLSKDVRLQCYEE